MDKLVAKPRELTGRHVLMMVVAFFVVIIAVNAIFISAAVTSFRGEDVKGSYRQGLEYNQTLAARDIQTELGWQFSANVTPQDDGTAFVIIAAADEAGHPLPTLNLECVLRHPTDLNQDRAITLKPMGGGKYKALLQGISGSWQLRAVATDGENNFKFEHSFHLL